MALVSWDHTMTKKKNIPYPSQFIATLLKNKDRYDDPGAKITVAEAIYHPEFSDGAPAHNYQYLQGAKNKLDLPNL